MKHISKFKTNKQASKYLSDVGVRINNGMDLYIPSNTRCLIQEDKPSEIKQTIKASVLAKDPIYAKTPIKEVDFLIKMGKTKLPIVEYNDTTIDEII